MWICRLRPGGVCYSPGSSGRKLRLRYTLVELPEVATPAVLRLECRKPYGSGTMVCCGGREKLQKARAGTKNSPPARRKGLLYTNSIRLSVGRDLRAGEGWFKALQGSPWISLEPPNDIAFLFPTFRYRRRGIHVVLIATTTAASPYNRSYMLWIRLRIDARDGLPILYAYEAAATAKKLGWLSNNNVLYSSAPDGISG